MAIPIRVNITCPQCDTSESETFADTSVGPQGRTSEAPVYSMFNNPLWDQTRRDGDTYLSCTTCGAADFITLRALAATMFGKPKVQKNGD
jgi:hypothetical protein